MNKTFRNVIYISFVTILLFSCVKKKDGIIKYSIEYGVSKDENPLINLLPKEMTYYFHDDVIMSSIEGWMSVFKSIQISNLADSTNTIILKLLDKKYYFKRKFSEPPLSFENITIRKIEKIDSVFMFKNYKCKKAIVYFNDTIEKPFEIFYTNDIKVKEPNRNNPFRSIPGVLMRFKMEIKSIPTYLEFESFQDTILDKKTFNIPPDYSKMSRNEMEDFFSELNDM